MKMMEGLATSSTAMVSRFRCSTERPEAPGSPTSVPRNDVSSIKAITCVASQSDTLILRQEEQLGGESIAADFISKTDHFIVPIV